MPAADRVRQWAALAILVTVGGCDVSKPHGVLGLRWGEPATEAASRLGLTCDAWEPWPGGAGFEMCRPASASISAFGAPASVVLIQKDGRIEGAQLAFADVADGGRLRQAILKEYDVEDSPSAYQTWSSGEAVRLEEEPQRAMLQLTVAGPRFGTAYAAWVLGGGIRDLGSGMQPR